MATRHVTATLRDWCMAGPSVAALVVALLFLASCSSVIKGSYPNTALPAPTPVTITTASLSFETPALPTVRQGGLAMSVTAAPVESSVRYAYKMTSRIKGKYLLMPAPPMIYTIYKIPTASSSLKNMQITYTLTIANEGNETLYPAKAIMAVAINGQTIYEKGVLLPEVRPGDQRTVSIPGIAVNMISGTKPNTYGTMNVGIYSLLRGSKSYNYSWQMQYVLTEHTRRIPVEIVAKTDRKQEAEAILKRLQADNSPGG